MLAKPHILSQGALATEGYTPNPQSFKDSPTAIANKVLIP